ncbi:hypothetical protein TNIN_142991 [Trichonephila inaurata madagascariensis]|uniref:Uncharacterized protein n=1 Tax=Trichonephila inaurata madagascariensis TaxID=2747483 RepID=A0A8X6IV76_9ARAC|nr:hypothetical protein TNIN_142991 [Trichonephila inaurata madagascariensis]
MTSGRRKGTNSMDVPLTPRKPTFLEPVQWFSWRSEAFGRRGHTSPNRPTNRKDTCKELFLYEMALGERSG